MSRYTLDDAMVTQTMREAEEGIEAIRHAILKALTGLSIAINALASESDRDSESGEAS